MDLKSFPGSLPICLCAILALGLLVASPSSAESVLNTATKPSLEVLDSYHLALEETVKQWPETNGQAPSNLTQSSEDLLRRLQQLISEVETDSGNGPDMKPDRIHQRLLAVYEAHHLVTRNALDAQIRAYERREEERAQAESRRDQSAEEEDEKDDIEKVFDIIFGRDSEESGSSQDESSEQANQPPSKPVANYNRPLSVQRRIMDGVTEEVQFLVDLNESDTTAKQTRLWLNHIELLLGNFLDSVLGGSSTAPLFADQYEQHLTALRESWDQGTLTFDGRLRTQLRRSLERQEQILGGVPYSLSSRAHDLEASVGQFLRELP